MADISPIAAPQRYALTIPNEARLQDHRFMGQAVLPAVYAMAYLAEIVGRKFPDVPVTASEDIRFDKFLVLPPLRVARVEAFAELGVSPDGGIAALLLTRHVAPKSGMSRMKVHVRARFGVLANMEALRPRATIWQDPPVGAYPLPPDRLYAEMVPFGKTFQNIVSPVDLRPEGARATVSGGAPGTVVRSPRLGTPFALDAAFHMACAWAQRYAGVVAFPVALQKRVILHTTLPGKDYDAWVRFKEEDGDCLVFDIWLHDRTGTLCEIVQGLTMRDVSGGKLQPPDWVRNQDRT